MADRLEEAEERLRAGDVEGALELLRRARRTAGTERDAGRLRAIVELAERVHSQSVGSAEKEASLFMFAARSDLAFAEKQDALVREDVEAARAAAAGDTGVSAAALEAALSRELEKRPRSRDQAVLHEIVALANAISPHARGSAASLLAGVLTDAEQALGPETRSPDEGLTARLDAFEQHIRSLESTLDELREKELPELRALAAAGPQAAVPAVAARLQLQKRRPGSRRRRPGAWSRRGPLPLRPRQLVLPLPRPVSGRQCRGSRSRSSSSRAPSPGRAES